jgi:MraZ protein
MFLGEYSHTIDDKGRLTIPAKFRDELESGIVITRGLDGCLWAYSRSEFDVLSDKIGQLPSTNPIARNFARFMFSGAFDSIPDRQGRILLPERLRTYAKIENETIIIGVKNKLEIWSPEQWSKIVDQVEGETDAFMAQLQELGI